MMVLEKMKQLEQAATSFGLQWETTAQIMAQIRSECLEIEEHLQNPEQKEALQAEIGDLLHAVLSLCIFCSCDPEQTLDKALNKFEHRLNIVKDIAKEQGLTHLKGKTFDELMTYWKQAKIQEYT